MRLVVLIACISFLCSLKAQIVINTDTVGAKTKSTLYVYPIGSDSLSSSFCIVIKDQVILHKHEFHSEQITVLEGAGEMQLGTNTYIIKKGDVIFVPKGTSHSVVKKGKKALKVISVQAPFFDGKDRIFLRN